MKKKLRVISVLIIAVTLFGQAAQDNINPKYSLKNTWDFYFFLGKSRFEKQLKLVKTVNCIRAIFPHMLTDFRHGFIQP